MECHRTIHQKDQKKCVCVTIGNESSGVELSNVFYTGIKFLGSYVSVTVLCTVGWREPCQGHTEDLYRVCTISYELMNVPTWKFSKSRGKLAYGSSCPDRVYALRVQSACMQMDIRRLLGHHYILLYWPGGGAYYTSIKLWVYICALHKYNT